MNVILFDDPAIREDLLPFTFTRPVAEIRVGMMTIAEKWTRALPCEVSFDTVPYLRDKFRKQTAELNYFINGAVCPNKDLSTFIPMMKDGEALVYHDLIIAACSSKGTLPPASELACKPFKISWPWEIGVKKVSSSKMCAAARWLALFVNL